jgi:hypothetical protein
VWNLSFSKKEPPPKRIVKRERFFFKKEQLPELYKRVDNDNLEDTQTSRYELWSYIQDCFPDIDMKMKSWRLEMRAILSPYLCETTFGKDEE